MFAGFLAGEGSTPPQAKAARLARDASAYAHVEARLLHDSAQLTLYGIVRDDTAHHLTVATAQGETVWLYRMDRAIPRKSEALVEQLRRHDWNHLPCLPGLWLALVWSEQDRSLRIVTERLGAVWLYVARCDQGLAFSSDFAALARLLEWDVRIDLDTALLELVFGYTPDDRTIFKEITLSPPGRITEYRGHTHRIVSASGLDFGDRYVGASRSEKFRALDDIYDQIGSESLTEERQVLSLSAGFDSRYGLALLQERGLKCPLLTFGDPESLEVEGARLVAERVGSETSLFSFVDAHWDSWARCIRTLGNTGMVQWAGWAEQWFSFLRERGGAAIIGYLGDALSGKHLVPGERHTPDWLERWVHWSAGPWSISPLLSEDARKHLWLRAHERFELLSSERSYALPHQSALHFDLLGRQRRWVASQPNLMARFVTPVTFFCHDELYNFWTNLPEEDLLGQRLYLEYARDRYRTLFPRNEGKTGWRARLANKARTLPRQLLGQKPRKPPPPIDRGRIVSQNKERILALVDASAQRFGSLIDISSLRRTVEALGEADSITPRESALVIQMTNLFLIATDRDS